MKLILENKKRLTKTILPEFIEGNYWIVDNNKNNLINIEAENNKWILKSNTEVKISTTLDNNVLSNTNTINSIDLNVGDKLYLINSITQEKYILYVLPTYHETLNLVVDFNKTKEFIVGNSSHSNNEHKVDVSINNPNIYENQLCFSYENGLKVTNLNCENTLYINGDYNNQDYINPGDSLFIAGMYIYVFGSVFVFSKYCDINFDSLVLTKLMLKDNNKIDYSKDLDKNIILYEKDDFFQRPPRFKRNIETKQFEIDPPTAKENQEEMPLIFTLMPMLTMGMTSIITGFTAINKIMTGESTLKGEFTSLLITGCMIISMLLFPLFRRFYMKMKKKKKERLRRKKYKKYIDNKREEIFEEINFQKQVLIEDNLPLANVANIILNNERTLWERKLDHVDFLNLRLGIGTRKPDIDIKYPPEKFTMEEDDLKDIIKDLVDESKDIVDVPITLNLVENNKLGVLGNVEYLHKYIEGLILQMIAYHGYDMLRLVILTTEKNKHFWNKYRNLPFIWSADKSIRYYATDSSEINKVLGVLKEEFNYRKEFKGCAYNTFLPYYLIISDDINTKNNILIKEIMESDNNYGYSIMMLTDKLDSLPNECATFINVDPTSSGIFTNEMTQENQENFKPDFINFDLNNCISKISNIPLDIANGKFILPKKYSFLEMYDVGNLKQLNIIDRWKNSDVINTLSAPVGIDEQGELFNIDLHEKAHGPHGLVAGMTGSGKSEWIITYILSMAVNYSPEEVQFVLIDYKGGGLALTFDDQENGIKLPHVVGTITNLDVVEINRSLASIESELKRRQTMFKEARETLSESSMDIYKYQSLYRQGKLKEPVSHLFIVSDEFAELKAQQPEFMDQLISTARIGRSLGVHLILATQKPSGVVDDQIWSNSKFRVCLKVQDKSDSNDMIKCPDAAMLKEAGRFYFQVGYNEFFAKGQSAYAGSPYYEADKRVEQVDASIEFVDELGSIVKSGNIKKEDNNSVFKGEELPNILNYIIETAKGVSLKVKPLWLTSIPKVIYHDKLANKYNYEKREYFLNPIIGEYDAPSKQSQGLLTIPLSENGNAIIYGSSGSGKELQLTTMIYSLITNHTPSEVNIYVLDFGAQVLNNFVDAPHVGDIISSGDDEKITNLFNFIRNEKKERKKKFFTHNGNYNDYISNSENKLPNIVVIINYYEIFNELYEDSFDMLVELTRDCAKYGIYFVLTTTATNGVRMKLSQNFKTSISLQLTADEDYRELFGNTYGVFPSKNYGRGLVKLDGIYEYQTAYAQNEEKLYPMIKELCEELKNKYEKAKPIPVLPEVVGMKDIKLDELSIEKIPFGLKKKDLSEAYINFNKKIGYVINCRNFDDSLFFIDNLLYMLNSTNNFNTFVFDSRYVYENYQYTNTKYSNSNYLESLNMIKEYCEKINTILSENNYARSSIVNVKDVIVVFLGIDGFIKSLSADEKSVFDNINKLNKDSMKIHYIFIDTNGLLKKFEYEAWFKECVDLSSGLYIGNGFAEQSTIKVSRVLKSYYDPIKYNMAYLVDDGMVDLIKLIEGK